MKWFRLVGGLSLILLSACSKSKTAEEVGAEIVVKLRNVPEAVRSIKDEATAKLAAERVRQLSQAFIQELNELDADAALTNDQRIAFQQQMREVNEETKYLVTQLRGETQYIEELAKPLAELGSVLETVTKRLVGE